MFTEEEQEYMKGLGLDFDFEHLSDEEWIQIEETVGDRLVLNCLDEDYYPNEEGKMCEEILSKLS